MGHPTTESVDLTRHTWANLGQTMKRHRWPEEVVEAAWQYVVKLTEHSEAGRKQAQKEIDDSARILNETERQWTRSRRVYIARAIREKVVETCSQFEITEEESYKIFTSNVLHLHE